MHETARTTAHSPTVPARAPARCRALLTYAVAVVAVVATALAAAPSSPAIADTPEVRHVADPAAPSIGLIGDSTLAGVRWFEAYGPLERFNFVFDAESCRRTIETSCWSRESYRASNAMDALQEHAGDWGDTLVMMTGYNDPSQGFRDGVEAIVAEAEQQGIDDVVWLSLRTKGVDYEEPLHQANGSTYRQANRTLYEVAEASGGSLHVADWASHSAEHPEWFESDGVHLSPEGAAAASEFIAVQLDALFAGRPVTPQPAPWEEVRPGDEGRAVRLVQAELLERGFDSVGAADGIYGDQTSWAVAQLQRSFGLEETGVVDEETAIEMGLAARRTPAPETVTTAAPAPVPPAVAAPLVGGAVATTVPPPAGSSAGTYALIAVAAAGGAWWWHRLRRRQAIAVGPSRRRSHSTRRSKPSGSGAQARPKPGSGAQARPKSGSGAQARPKPGSGAQARPKSGSAAQARPKPPGAPQARSSGTAKRAPARSAPVRRDSPRQRSR